MRSSRAKKREALPEIIAHRGASHGAPENTLAAFRLAFKQGADGIEGDFRLTADGRIVCIHDHSTGRVAGSDLSVARSDFRDLRRLDVGAWKGARWAGQRIPSIAEVLAEVPRDKKIYIEIKCGHAILPGLERAVRDSGLEPDQTVFISFSSDVVARAKRRFPDSRALWIVGYRRAKKTGRIEPSLDAILRRLHQIKADGVDSRASRMVDARFIKAVASAGFELHIWTTGGVSSAARFMKPGIRAVTTNHPRALRAALPSTTNARSG